jgi:hypothetical protein
MSIIAVVSSVTELVGKVKNAAEQWDKKKTTKEQLVNFIGEDANIYLQTFEEISSIAPARVYPILDEIKEIPTKSQIDTIVTISIDVQIKFTEIISRFIKIIKDCSLISKNEAFMKNLLETDSILYDFVKRMDSVYCKNDVIKIDENYYGFFKLYENQLLKKQNKKIVNAAVDEAKLNLKIVKKKIVPNLSSNMIGRENKKRFRESFEKLSKVTKKILVAKPVDVEMHEYVLPDLKPIVVLLEEIIIDMEKRAKTQKYRTFSVKK